MWCNPGIYIKTAFISIYIICFNTALLSQEKDKKNAEIKDNFSQQQKDSLAIATDTLDISTLLEGPDIQGNLDYSLMTAASEGNIAFIKWLLKHGANIETTTSENVTPLLFAVASNRKEAVRVLLENNADPNANSMYSETPLIVAVRNQNLEIAELLIRDSADINLTDENGATALHYACIYGYFYVVDLLLYYNAAVYLKSFDGTTPLMAAIWAGFADIADLLMQNNADPSEKDKQGFSPFLIAAQNGDTVIMNLLLKRRVNIYDVNKFNYNALDLCIKGNHKEAVKYLLRIGDKWSSQKSEIVNPFSVALVYKRKDMTNLLKENNFNQTKRPGIDQISVSASMKTCFYDYQFGLSVMAKEPSFNLGFISGIDFKPYYTRVLIKEGDNLYYQYRDKSALIYAGVFKEIPLTDYLLKGNWSFIGTLSLAYSFGNKLKGTSIVPGNQFRLNPAASLIWTKNSFGLLIGIEYLNTVFYRTGPIWVRAGVSYTMFFNNLHAPGKIIKWY